MKFPQRLFIMSAASAVIPATASAHLVSTGLGPVYDGIFHLVLTPEEIMPLVAFALFVGLRGPQHAKQAMFLLPPAWLLGCLMGGGVPRDQMPGIVAGLGSVIFGGLLAADAKISPLASALCAVLMGLIFGSVAGTAYAGGWGILGALGEGSCVFVLLALVASVSLPLRRLPAIIAVRISGSWIAAMGLLLAGWWARGKAP